LQVDPRTGSGSAVPEPQRQDCSATITNDLTSGSVRLDSLSKEFYLLFRKSGRRAVLSQPTLMCSALIAAIVTVGFSATIAAAQSGPSKVVVRPATQTQQLNQQRQELQQLQQQKSQQAKQLQNQVNSNHRSYSGQADKFLFGTDRRGCVRC
jgi:uncharacterized protein YlxW (UPF0749 family)